MTSRRSFIGRVGTLLAAAPISKVLQQSSTELDELAVEICPAQELHETGYTSTECTCDFDPTYGKIMMSTGPHYSAISSTMPMPCERYDVGFFSHHCRNCGHTKLDHLLHRRQS